MMFKKVLIAEDHESINISVQKTLADLGIAQDNRNYVFYCDDALMRIQKAIKDQEPYELLITDLSFDEDATGQKITTGQELIKAARLIQPDLKVLVFTVENRAAIANAIVKELGINAYVPKARRDAQDLKLAIEHIFRDKKYISPNLKKMLKEEDHYDFTEFDKTIIKQLVKGPQKDIPAYLKHHNITPSGLSSIEKRLNYIKTILNISTNEQLIAYCKDKHII